MAAPELPALELPALELPALELHALELHALELHALWRDRPVAHASATAGRHPASPAGAF
jgi:hypothetical protein